MTNKLNHLIENTADNWKQWENWRKVGLKRAKKLMHTYQMADFSGDPTWVYYLGFRRKPGIYTRWKPGVTCNLEDRVRCIEQEAIRKAHMHADLLDSMLFSTKSEAQHVEALCKLLHMPMLDRAPDRGWFYPREMFDADVIRHSYGGRIGHLSENYMSVLTDVILSLRKR